MLRVSLVCIGRLKASAERDLSQRYIERAKTAGRAAGLVFDIRELDESRARRAEDRKVEEAAAIRDVIGPGARVFALAEHGDAVDSPTFANILGAARDQGAGGLTLVIGGPDGLAPEFCRSAHKVIAFGALTWPHQLIRIMASEQLYRAVTILNGHPYHRT